MAASRETIRLAVVGHLDHGKSTLIGRLCHDAGVIRGAPLADWAHYLDYLEEERRQAMTLETTQAAIDVGDRRLVLIDVPGHHELLRNMLTGASQADAAILVLAVDEGVKEQTRRHAAVLDLLGLRQVLVAVNKLDAVGFAREPFATAAAAVRQALGMVGIEPLAVVPVSARQGDNLAVRSARMPWYDGWPLGEWLGELRSIAAPCQAVRFPVQDVYRQEARAVLVGRLAAGRIAAGDELVLCPARTTVTVTEICRFPPDGRPIVAGECAGLTVAGAVARRGDVLAAAAALPLLTATVSARLLWLAAAPLAPDADLLLRCATREVSARIAAVHQRLDSATLAPKPAAGPLEWMDLATVTIGCAETIAVEPFTRLPALGRFVLEWDRQPVAAGIVLSG